MSFVFWEIYNGFRLATFSTELSLNGHRGSVIQTPNRGIKELSQRRPMPHRVQTVMRMAHLPSMTVR